MIWHRYTGKYLFNLKLIFMHNTDRTTGEMGFENEQELYGEYNQESFETNELAQEWENAFESEDEYQGEYAQEYQGEYNQEMQGEVFHEAMETELATELLNVNSESEMDQFLGKLVRKAAGAVSSFAKSSAGKAIGGFLKSAAKKALPFAGRALGTAFGGPLGGAIGGKLGSFASTLFEVQLEGLSNEDKEYEIAKAYVRFAGDAVRRAARNPAYRYNPRQVVKSAVVNSARRHAPGFLRRRAGRRRYPTRRPQPQSQIQSQFGAQYGGGMQQPSFNGAFDGGQSSDSGTWYRDGNQIILTL
jgi:hypothetical protein